MDGRPRGRPRAEPVAVQRRRILDVARRSFVAHGFDGVTVAGVAEDAEVSRATVYGIVGDKGDLVAAVFAEVATSFEQSMAARLAAAAGEPLGTIPELIDAQVRWFLETLIADPEMRMLLTISNRMEDVSPAVALVRRRVEDALTDVYVEVAAAYGVERRAGARLAAVMILALVEAVAVRPDVDGPWPLDEVVAVVGSFVAGAIERTERAGGVLDAFDSAVDQGTP